MSLSKKEKIAWGLTVNSNLGWYGVVNEFADISDAYKNLGKFVPSPIRGGKDGFRLLPKFDECGEGVDNSIGFCPNGIALVAMILGSDRETAAEEIIKIFNDENISKRKPVRADFVKKESLPAISREDKIKMLNQTMQSCSYIPEAIQKYMSSRGVNIPLEYMPWNIFHTMKAPKIGGGQKEALICAVTGKNGDLRTGHRIFLDNGEISLSLTQRKLLMMTPDGVKGGLIRGYPIVHGANDLFLSDVRGFTEGPEDMICTTYGTGVPTVAGVSSTILQDADFEDNFSVGVIFADNDLAGKKAAFKLAKKLFNAKKKVIIAFPSAKEGYDWNDLLRDYGREAFPDIKKEMNMTRKVKILGNPGMSWAKLKEEVNKPFNQKSSMTA